MDAIRQLLESRKPVKWLFYGDSITHGAVHTFGWRDYTQLFAERVRHELGRAMDVILNTAISGNTTRNLIEGFDWRVTQFHPDVMFLMIGMNDCSRLAGVPLADFEHNLAEIADRTAAIGTRMVLQTTCPIVPGTAPDREADFSAYMDAVRRAAEARHLPLIDHQHHWQQRADRHFLWMSNAFHPNGYGHQVFAVLLFRQLGIYDPASPCCRFFCP
jgi:lysophospholipase L1-like esterase